MLNEEHLGSHLHAMQVNTYRGNVWCEARSFLYHLSLRELKSPISGQHSTHAASEVLDSTPLVTIPPMQPDGVTKGPSHCLTLAFNPFPLFTLLHDCLDLIGGEQRKVLVD